MGDAILTNETDPTFEGELRRAMNAATQGHNSAIDSATIVHRARARRRPKLIAAGSISVLAVAGIFALGISSLPSLHEGQVSSDAGMSMVAPESRGGNMPTDSSNKMFYPDADHCGLPWKALPHTATDSNLELRFSPSRSDSGRIAGTATLTNGGDARVQGSTPAQPTLIFARDGIVASRPGGVASTLALRVDLRPGESFTYPVASAPISCGTESAAPLSPGTYDLFAAIVFTPDSSETGSANPVLVSTSIEDLDVR